MWTKYNLEKDKAYCWRIGLLEIYVRKIRKEWQIAHRKGESFYSLIEIAKEVPEPEQVEWKSFITDKNDSLHIVPALPDRPIVVKPGSKFRLLPGKHVQLFIYIPACIQFYSGTVQHSSLIYEIPMEELSSTWFGDPDNGILAYSIPGSFHQTLEKDLIHDHEIICPVRIYNTSPSYLDIQRLCIHSESLSIYNDSSQLITNEIKLSFKGESLISDIHYFHHAPSFAEKAKHLAYPRNPDRNNVFRKSFHFIKSLTEY